MFSSCNKINADDSSPPPVDSVGRFRIADMVPVLGFAGFQLPLATGHVPHSPNSAIDKHTRIGNEIWVLDVSVQDRALRNLAQGLASAFNDGKADGISERNCNSEVPTEIVKILFVFMVCDPGKHGSGIVKSS